jgi:transposase
VIHGDKTSLQVLKEADRTAQSSSYMWVYRSAEEHAQPVVLFDCQPDRGHEHPEGFLNGFAGASMTDGYAAWRMSDAALTKHSKRRSSQTGAGIHRQAIPD